MGSWVPTGVKRILDDFLAARTYYVSFHTADPGTNGANEYTSNNIARVSIGAQTSTTDSDSADSQNNAAITSAAANGATAAIHWVGLWTAATGGVFLAEHELVNADGSDASVTLALGEKFNIPINDLDFSFPIS